MCPLVTSLYILQEQPDRATAVSEALVSEIQDHCQCSFAPSDIQEPSFQCFPESNQAVTFRAITTSTFINDISRWIADDGLLRVQTVFIRVDKSCQVQISSFADTECTTVLASSESSAAVIGGVVGGVVIVLIIAVTVIVIAVLVFKNRREKLTIHRTTKLIYAYSLVEIVHCSLSATSINSCCLCKISYIILYCPPSVQTWCTLRVPTRCGQYG